MKILTIFSMLVLSGSIAAGSPSSSVSHLGSRQRPCGEKTCGPRQECRESPSGDSRECRCELGYKFNSENECVKITCEELTCSRNEECVASRGYCQCKEGYWEKQGKCVAHKCEVDDDCGVNEKCNKPSCVCQEGYISDSKDHCIADPCKQQPCGTNQICWAYGERAHCSCKPGYVMKSGSKDECIENPCKSARCGWNMQCRVKDDKAECVCQRGYIPNVINRQSGCIRDVCLDKTCGTNQECRVQIIDFEDPDLVDAVCRCKAGYHFNSKDECVKYEDLDPCEQTYCGQGRECQVRGGNPTCLCSGGHRGPTGDCEPDSNYCSWLDGLINCGSERCIWSNGQIECKCPEGYYHNKRGDCVKRRDVDPCQGVSCGQNQRCEVINKESTCVCKDGYKREKNTCV